MHLPQMDREYEQEEAVGCGSGEEMVLNDLLYFNLKNIYYINNIIISINKKPSRCVLHGCHNL